MTKTNEQKESDKLQVKERISIWLKNGINRKWKLNKVQEKIYEIDSEYDSLVGEKWSLSWIYSLKTELGMTKKSFKKLGIEKKLKNWIQNQTEKMQDITTQTFAKKYKQITGKKATRTFIRQFRKSNNFICVAKRTKLRDTWVKESK